MQFSAFLKKKLKNGAIIIMSNNTNNKIVSKGVRVLQKSVMFIEG